MSKAKELLERYGKVTEDKRQVIDTLNGSIYTLRGQIENYESKQLSLKKRMDVVNFATKEKLRKEYHELGVKIEQAKASIAKFQEKRRDELARLKASK